MNKKIKVICACAFSNYEDYREFVLGSRKLKDNRYKEV